MFLQAEITAQGRFAQTIQWKIAAELPGVNGKDPGPGLAGAIAGVHEGVMILAGGANFPEGMPWEGGRKKYYDEVFVYKRQKSGKLNLESGGKLKLKEPVAYSGIAVSDRGIVSIGGENEKGIVKKVFLLQWDKITERLQIKDLPDIPYPLTDLAAVANGSLVYAAGGETINSVTTRFLCLNLDDLKAGWKRLPDLPYPVSNALLLHQAMGEQHAVYLLGGRKKNSDGVSEFYADVHAYDPAKNEWQQKKSMPYALAAGTGIIHPDGFLLLFGGDKGIVYNRTEELIAAIYAEADESKKQELVKSKNLLQSTHPGFSKQVLIYDILENEWSELGEIPFASPVTTSAFWWEEDFYIPSGEIRAGVRTPQILHGSFRKKK